MSSDVASGVSAALEKHGKEALAPFHLPEFIGALIMLAWVVRPKRVDLKQAF